MANISILLDKIKNAIYGEEVRGSIHDALDVVNDDLNDLYSSYNEMTTKYDYSIGTLNELYTSDKTNLVNAINEVYMSEGGVDLTDYATIAFVNGLVNPMIEDISDLETTNDSLLTSVGTINSEIGNLTLLNTVNKSNLVSAINEVAGKTIDLTDYATIAFVNGLIGDIDDALDSILAIQTELLGGVS